MTPAFFRLDGELGSLFQNRLQQKESFEHTVASYCSLIAYATAFSICYDGYKIAATYIANLRLPGVGPANGEINALNELCRYPVKVPIWAQLGTLGCLKSTV